MGHWPIPAAQQKTPERGFTNQDLSPVRGGIIRQSGAIPQCPKRLIFKASQARSRRVYLRPNPKRKYTVTDASKLQAIPADEWNASLGHIVDDMDGNPLNVHSFLANNPDLLSAWWPLRNYLVAGGSLGKRNAELVILRTAVRASNWYEWASHVVRGLKSDLSLTEIERVIDGPAHPDWAEPDALLLLAVDELAVRGALNTETVENLAAHFGHKAILDLIALRSMYVMLADILNTWEVVLDKHVADALPDTVTQDRFESLLS